MKTKNELTSNQYYGAINRRFDKRAARLVSLGFKVERFADLKIAMFVKRNRLGVVLKSIPNAVVSSCDNRFFNDQIASVRHLFGAL